MCSCNTGTNTSCSGRVGELQKIRNQLITLEKLVSGDKLEEYRGIRTEVETLMRDSSTSCPEAAVVLGLKSYIDNEYASNIN